MNFTWRPGIGDPSVAGWLTVALYLAAAWMAFRIARQLSSQPTAEYAAEARVWIVLAVGFLLLGINKQLDLQSALTEIGRMAAYFGGWYEKRRIVQFTFLIVVFLVACVTVVELVLWARKSPPATWIALCGTIFVATFVVMRAASFHHVDELIGSRLLGLKWNWILEMSGIAIVIVGAAFRGTKAVPRH